MKLMRKFCILLLIIVLPLASVQAEEKSNGLDGVSINTITDTLMLKNSPEYLMLKVRMDIPQDYPKLQRYIASKIFYATSSPIFQAKKGRYSLKKAYELYFEVYKRYKRVKHTPKISDDVHMQSIDIKCTGYKSGGYLSYGISVKQVSAESLKRRTSDPKERFDFAQLEFSSVTEYHIIYDIKADKVMDFDDVFATDAIEEKHGNKAIYNFALSKDFLYWSPEEENDLYVTPLAYLKEKFTENFCRFIDWEKVETNKDTLKIKLAAMSQEKAMEKQRMEQRLQELRLHEYQLAGRNAKDLYLYMWDSVCYVSGLNRNIMELSEAEIDELGKNKKTAYIVNEIREAKDYIRNGGTPGVIQVFDDMAETLKANANAYTAEMCHVKPQPPKPVIDCINKNWKGKHGFGHSKIQYIVDRDGTVHMPIVIVMETTSAGIDASHAAALRKIRKWTPGEVDGSPVRTIMISAIGVTTTYTWRKTYTPNYNKWSPGHYDHGRVRW